MQAREFLFVALELARGATEAHWRVGAARAYYALLHECQRALEQWGWPIPRRESIHTFVRFHFAFPAHPDLKFVGDALQRLVRLRNEADYRLAVAGSFARSAAAKQAVQQAADAIARLDQLQADPQKKAAAIAALRKAFP